MLNKGKIDNKLIGLITTIAILVFMVISINSRNSYKVNQVIQINNWQCKVGNEIEENITLPIEKIGVNKIEARNILPNADFEDPYLVFRTLFQNVKVYVDGEVIYTRKANKKNKVTSYAWQIVKLPENYQGKEIQINYELSNKSIKQYVSSVTVGNLDSQIIFYFNTYGRDLVRAGVLFAFGTMLLVVNGSVTKSIKNKLISLYLGMLNILFSIYTVMDCKIIDFFLSDNLPLARIKYICICAIPILLIDFINKILNDKRYGIIRKLYIIILVIALLSGIRPDISLSIIVDMFHGLNIILIIRMIYDLIKLEKGRAYIVYPILGLVPVSIDICRYYAYNGEVTTVITQYTIAIITVIYCCSIGKKYFVLEKNEIENEIFKRLAYNDNLTNLYNRTAFDKKMQEINRDIKSYTGMYIFVLDVNKLKQINDTHGHIVGDKYIIEWANLIKGIFSDLGETFRVGGDEFVVLCNNKVNIEERLNHIEKNILSAHLKDFDECYGVAYGYDIVTNATENVYDIYSSADKNMYKTKKYHK